jgi:hypothetical protein
MRLRPLSFPAATLASLLVACGGSSAPAVPDHFAESEPNGTLALANAISLHSVVTGSITADTDLDFFKFTVPAGGASVRFRTFDSTGKACDPVAQGVDPYLAVYDSAGTLLAGADDTLTPPTFCEDLTVALPAGTAYVMVGGYAPFPFNYTLQVTGP